MEKKLLPVGSVVFLEGAKKRTVIMGIAQIDQENPSKIYDYMGVPYPCGYLGRGSAALFDHNAIQEVVFEGYSDSERDTFLKAAFDAMDEIARVYQKSMEK